MADVPGTVRAARSRARGVGFQFSCGDMAWGGCCPCQPLRFAPRGRTRRGRHVADGGQNNGPPSCPRQQASPQQSKMTGRSPRNVIVVTKKRANIRFALREPCRLVLGTDPWQRSGSVRA